MIKATQCHIMKLLIALGTIGLIFNLACAIYITLNPLQLHTVHIVANIGEKLCFFLLAPTGFLFLVVFTIFIYTKSRERKPQNSNPQIHKKFKIIPHVCSVVFPNILIRQPANNGENQKKDDAYNNQCNPTFFHRFLPYHLRGVYRLFKRLSTRTEENHIPHRKPVV